VREYDAHAFADEFRQTGAARDVFERTVTPVAEELVRLAGVVVRMAVERMLRRAAAAFGARVPAHVVRYEEVEQAVAIVVEPARGDRPQLAELRIDAGHPGFAGDVCKLAVIVPE